MTNGRDAWFTFYTTMRSYGQHCALAKALEVIGDRWSLLIVRELMLGQERWGELRDGLPGIAKNLLAERLRDLEAAGVLTHEGDRYLLTDDGRALEGTITALLLWGAPRLAAAPAEDDEFRRAGCGSSPRATPRSSWCPWTTISPSCAPAGTELSGQPGTCWPSWPGWPNGRCGGGRREQRERDQTRARGGSPMPRPKVGALAARAPKVQGHPPRRWAQRAERLPRAASARMGGISIR